jgi:arabinogalactan endo-1,4-beta-galactosidase
MRCGPNVHSLDGSPCPASTDVARLGWFWQPSSTSTASTHVHQHPHKANSSHDIGVFVINLDRDAHRLRQIGWILEGLGVPFVRWAATSGDDLSLSGTRADVLEDGLELRGFDRWSANEAACAVSHVRLLRYFLKSDLSWAIVLEDDAIPRVSFPLSSADWDLPAEAELVLLNDRSVGKGSTGRDSVRSVGKGSTGRDSVWSYSEVLGGAGTEGYLISRRGAEKLISLLNPLCGPLDFQMFSHIDSVRKYDRAPLHWSEPRNPLKPDLTIVGYKLEESVVLHRNASSSIGNSRHPDARRYCEVLLGMVFLSTASHYYSYPSGSSSQGQSKEPGPSSAEEDAFTDVIHWRGVDVTHRALEPIYRTSSRSAPDDLLSVLRDLGFNIVRTAVWPSDASIAAAVELSRHASAVGLDVFLALHLADDWADPALQRAPFHWEADGRSGVRRELQQFVSRLIGDLCEQRTPPRFVQIGNEVTNGMLWPFGALAKPWDDDASWRGFADLFNSASASVRAASLGHTVDIVLHLDRATEVTRNYEWVEKALSAGVAFDCLGLSYHPTLGDRQRPEALQDLGRLSGLLRGRPVLLAEVAYPGAQRTASRGSHLLSRLPATQDGQRRFVERLYSTLLTVPNVSGLIWWAGAAVPGANCPDHVLCFSLFDAEGSAHPAARLFRQ